MAYVSYTAKRSITPQHVLNGSYFIEFRHIVHDRSRKVISKENRALGGQSEVMYQRSDNEFSITTELIDAVFLPAFREFLDSVEAGEGFVIDPDGLSNAPVSAVNAVLVKGSGRESRDERFYRFRWRYRES